MAPSPDDTADSAADDAGLTPLADRLLQAQVAWILAELDEDGLAERVAADLDRLLTAGRSITVAALVDPADVKAIAHHLHEVVPPSTAASTLVVQAADVIWDGPHTAFTLADVVDRENVALLTDEALALTDLVETFLDRVADSPVAAGLAARFVGRLVNDVIQANRAVAEKIPGVGSLVSFGASAAGKVIGAADKQLESLIGDTAGKGAAFAMRRLNKVIVETMKDPSAREAVLQVFDMYADQPVPRVRELADQEDLRRVAGLLQDIVIAGAPTEPVLALLDALIDGFFAVYGDEPVSTLIDDLGLTPDDLTSHLTPIVGRVARAAAEAGLLEELVRERLRPFYSSPDVAALLG